MNKTEIFAKINVADILQENFMLRDKLYKIDCLSKAVIGFLEAHSPADQFVIRTLKDVDGIAGEYGEKSRFPTG